MTCEELQRLNKERNVETNKTRMTDSLLGHFRRYYGLEEDKKDKIQVTYDDLCNGGVRNNGTLE